MNIIKSIGAKAFTMALALVCGLTTTRLLITDAGAAQYALYTLLIALPNLIGFTDLGSGAVVVNRVARSDDPRRDPLLVGEVTTVGRIMIGFAAAAMVLNTVMLTTGLWQSFLGEAGDLTHAPVAAFLSITVFCLGIPLGIWTRLLIGLQRNHILILIQGAQSPLTLLAVWLVLQFDAPSLYPFLAVFALIAAFLVVLTGFLVTSRLVSPLIGTVARRVPFPRAYPRVRVMDMGWPMLAQLLTTPLAMQSQRFILAQFVTTIALAQYAMAGQFFFALQGLVSAVGLTLWPRYTRARELGTSVTGPFTMAAYFAGGVIVFTTGMLIAGPWIFAFISDGDVHVPVEVILAFGAMVATQAALYPLGMFQMDTAGVRFQVFPGLLMAAMTVALAFALTPVIGTVGPLLANTFAVLVCQIIPYGYRIIRLRRVTA
ncbi:lipopolysaccharide biosynthesis protein [Plantibacter sp. T3]|uniref:lipopolysaccharide biosynthesis protein n=1 Tax=Plantibacter sp. T3 TaxID=2653161 RepID=UPI0012F07F91|nr:polysaccharide biosynthesis protein [Plantibacter sp. T3]VXB73943.1 conserved membrane hypothetical protein [Plantibacter sp. T3]